MNTTLTFTKRNNAKYFSPLTDDLKKLYDEFTTPEDKDLKKIFRMPNITADIGVTVNKKLILPLNKPIDCVVELKLYDFDDENGKRCVGAYYYLSRLCASGNGNPGSAGTLRKISLKPTLQQ
jgi:hypothetical protein